MKMEPFYRADVNPNYTFELLQEAKNCGSGGRGRKVRLTRLVGRGAMIGDDKRVEQLKLCGVISHGHLLR